MQPCPIYIGSHQLQLASNGHVYHLYFSPSYPPTPFSRWLHNQSPWIAQLELLPYTNTKGEIDELGLDDWQVIGRRDPVWSQLQTKEEMRDMRGIGRQLLYICVKDMVERKGLSLDLRLTLQAVGGDWDRIKWETIPSEIEAKQQLKRYTYTSSHIYWQRPYGTLLRLCQQNEKLVEYYQSLGFIRTTPLSVHVNMETTIKQLLNQIYFKKI